MAGGTSYRDKLITGIARILGDFQAAFTDISGAPGPGIIPTPRGRVAIPPVGISITVSSPLVTAGSAVFTQIRGADPTFTNIVSVITGPGTFTITGDAAATGIVVIDLLIVN